METIYRPHLTHPGEGLLLLRPSETDDGVHMPGVAKLSERAQQWSTDSGTDADDAIINPVMATPIPNYSRIPDSQRRWPGTKPTIMWHPLMWLPSRLAYPYAITTTDDDGTPHERLESPTEWMIRVCLELTSAGLYDPDTGGWMDVLSHHGLDITNQNTLDRVRSWLDGAADPDLDAIDLGSMFTADDPEWAVKLASDMFDDVVMASWHLVAEDFLVSLDAIAQMDDPQQVREQITTVMTVASTLMPDAIIDLDLDVSTRISQIYDALEYVHDDALITGPVDDLQQMFSVVARGYQGSMDVLDSISIDA